MATFGADYYGRSKYGGTRRIDFGVEPFTAHAITFDAVRVEWNDPSGDWGGFRLLRSRAGYPVNESDGVVLYETTSSPSSRNFVDTGLTAGWVYYSIFLYNTARGTWERAGTVDTMVAYDFKSTDRLWSLLPDYYKQVRDPGAGFSQSAFQINPAIYLSNEQSVPNEQLIRFLHVFGYSFDHLRTQIDTVLDGYDPRTMHQKRLTLLAEQFGGEIYPGVPAANNRNLVRNLGLLYRKRGTVDGIRELLELATGYDIDVRIGKNMMLNEDQSQFVHPQVPPWDPFTRYTVGDRVRYGAVGQFFEALQTAYGVTQGPNIDYTANAYWRIDKFVEELVEDTSVNRVDTGDVSTWQVKIDGGAVVPENTFIAAGYNDPTNPAGGNYNSLAFKNYTGAPATMIVRSIPLNKDETTALDRRLTLESAIPIPVVVNTFTSGKAYETDDLVMHLGRPWRATRTTTETPSTSSSHWERLGHDKKIRLCFSMHVHGKFSGVVNSGSQSVQPYFMSFNESGDLTYESYLTAASTANVFYDPFIASGGLVSGRAGATGGIWESVTGSWSQGVNQDGGYMYPAGTTRTFSVTNSGIANTNVGVTFKALGAREMGLVFRYSDASNFWMATHSGGLYKVVAGAARANPSSGAASWSAFVPGERMTVVLNGNSITVKRDGVTVATATDSFNSTATRHGIITEA